MPTRISPTLICESAWMILPPNFIYYISLVAHLLIQFNSYRFLGWYCSILVMALSISIILRRRMPTARHLSRYEKFSKPSAFGYRQRRHFLGFRAAGAFDGSRRRLIAGYRISDDFSDLSSFIAGDMLFRLAASHAIFSDTLCERWPDLQPFMGADALRWFEFTIYFRLFRW